jgi:hypothetical protein
MLALAKALHLLRQGNDPDPVLSSARGALQRLVDEAPWDIDYRILRAQAEILGARFALQKGTLSQTQLEAAMLPLQPMLDRERARPQLYQTIAEIHELRAAWLMASRKSPAGEIQKGIEMADEALARNPHMATAHAVKGALYVLQAREALESRAPRDPASALEPARRAKEAFAAALRDNPLIERDRGAIIEETRNLLAAQPAR